MAEDESVDQPLCGRRGRCGEPGTRKTPTGRTHDVDPAVLAPAEFGDDELVTLAAGNGQALLELGSAGWLAGGVVDKDLFAASAVSASCCASGCSSPVDTRP